MQLHRFYLPPTQCGQDVLRLEGQEARHALRVLRLALGDAAIVQDGAGNEYFCEVENASRDSLSLLVKRRNFVSPPPCAITLFVGIPKGKIIESIIQKSVELGARRIVPLLTERVVTRLDEEGAGHKREQWQQTAIEAMKQCGAARLPEIEAPVVIETFLAKKEKPDLQLVGSLQKERRHPREIFREYEKANGHAPASAAIWIGPEGDFTPDELKAIQKAGAHPISLGNLVLRVETAAIYCLSILNYEFNSSTTAKQT
jgi:16S rRNA (uracil1498-N3)-methyltransferase